MDPTANPLTDFSDLPRFADFLPEHVTPALDALLAEARAALATATAPETPVTWDDLVEPLTDAVDRLHRAWSAISHLNAVADTPAWRQAYNDNVTRVPEFDTELGQNQALFGRYRALAADPAFGTWSGARRRVVELALREFRLSGADLAEADRARFAALEQRLADLAAQFGQNDQDATDAFQLLLPDATRLAGLPDDAKAQFAQAAEAGGHQGYLVTLQYPSYLPVMRLADDRTLRADLYKAFVQLASEFGPPAQDNTPIIRERLQLLAEEARLLGYANYAELSVVRKMADTPAQALAFLRDLAARAKPFAVRDRQELEAFAHDHLGLATLEAWDLAWASEKLRQAKYAYTSEEVKQYFPLPVVLEGLFGLLNTLYGIRFAPAPASVWHPSVRYYEVLRGDQAIAGLYLDLHAREGKRSGAWMDDARGRRLRSGQVQRPLAHVVCNFPPAVGSKPALLPHGDVETLFHEFGHALQHLLTRVDEVAVAGIAGVEWDAVELPSQIMENFCWEWNLVQSLSRHVDTGARLPRELFDKMLAAKNFQSGMATVRQLEFGLFDLRLHSDFDPEGGDWLALLDEVRREVAVNVPPAWNRFPNTFSHIFGGGYAAGYYSYKWAEVLSADAYSAFEEEGGPNPVTGGRFLDEILAVGGSRPSAQSFRAFRGRDPRVDALLRHNGMA